MDYDALQLWRGYGEARSLGSDALGLWRDAIRRAVPATDIHLVLDVGAGTGHFAPVLADLFGARVLALEPSLGMLGQRNRGLGAPVAFAAAAAQALPVRDGFVDLVFLSMVYHHLGSTAAALAELGRVLRPGGWVLIRNTTRETLDSLPYLRFFPEAKRMNAERMPARAAVLAAFQGHGFAVRHWTTVRQLFAADPREYFHKISLRGVSSLQVLSDAAFATGLREFEEYCRERADDPIWEPLDLFAFQDVRTPLPTAPRW